jgi:yeast amino acid transporter
MPAIFNRVDSKGRPYWSLLSCAVVGIVMTYINCSTNGATAFTWFSSVSATTTFFAWITIPITNFCMHRALKAQADPAFSERYAFKTKWYPAAPVFLLVSTLFTFASTIYVSASPLEGEASATVFFQTMLCMPLFFFCYGVYKIYFRTKMVKPEEADLKTGRRQLTEKDLEFLDSYYAQPMWRRALSYVRF